VVPYGDSGGCWQWAMTTVPSCSTARCSADLIIGSQPRYLAVRLHPCPSGGIAGRG
jgi:hypothetical protein